METNIDRIRKLRDDLEKGGMKKERLDIFDAMFHTYERKLTSEQDFSDSQMYDFYLCFALEIDKLIKEENEL